jgi:glycosyltransferase involved in cell wall biosynthesis
VTIHDLNYLDPSAVRPDGVGGLRRTLREAGYRVELGKARHARRLITVSEHMRDSIVRVLGVDPALVKVTYEAADSPADVEPDLAILARYGLDTPFFLYVGSAYPYKNLPRLIDAFARVRGDYLLVLAGDQEEFGPALRQRAADAGVTQRVVFPGPVSEHELAALYGAATAYTFVSYAEGFGLPGLEAMRSGLPVVAASAGSLPEICGDAARYCDPHDVESIAAALAEIATNEQLRERLITLGRRRASEFSWRRTAEQTLAIYERAMAASPARIDAS